MNPGNDPDNDTTRAEVLATPPRNGGPNIKVIAALVAVGGLLLGTIAVLASGNDDPEQVEEESWHGALLGQPQPRPDFTLTDTDGNAYDFATETEGRLTLLFFGYTSCPDVCPIQMATLSAALDQPAMPKPTVVFVTTDPARDTPEKLRSWLNKFDTTFVGLHGTRDEVRAAEMAAQVPPSILGTGEGDGQPSPSSPSGSPSSPSGGARPDAATGAGASAPTGDYEVGHAAQVIAYTPDDLAHVVYPQGVRRQDWMADLPRLMNTWGTPVADADGNGVDAGDAQPATDGDDAVVVGDLTVHGGWAAADDEISAAYLTVENAGRPDNLESASSDVAESVHIMSGEAMDAASHGDDGHDDLPDDAKPPLAVPAGTTHLKSGGWHIMIEDLVRPLKAGERITVRLTFEHAGEVDVPIEIVTWDQAVERADAQAEGHGR